MALPYGVDGYWYMGCDHRFLYDKAKDVDGNYLNNGMCEYEIVDYDGVSLAEGVLDYQTASDGKYLVDVDQSAVPDTTPFGTTITLVVTFSDTGNDDKRILRLMVERRTNN